MVAEKILSSENNVEFILQSRLEKMSKIYPFKRLEYVYSGNQIKSVIIDVEDFLSLIEAIETEANVSSNVEFRDYELGEIKGELTREEIYEGRI